MNVQPLGDRVVVEREEAKATTAGGIVLPDTAKDKPQKGKVLAIGDGRITKDGKRRPLQVKVGDDVIFTSYAGDEFKLDGDKKVLLMREDDILAVVSRLSDRRAAWCGRPLRDETNPISIVLEAIGTIGRDAMGQSHRPEQLGFLRIEAKFRRSGQIGRVADRALRDIRPRSMLRPNEPNFQGSPGAVARAGTKRTQFR